MSWIVDIDHPLVVPHLILNRQKKLCAHLALDGAEEDHRVLVELLTPLKVHLVVCCLVPYCLHHLGLDRLVVHPQLVIQRIDREPREHEPLDVADDESLCLSREPDALDPLRHLRALPVGQLEDVRRERAAADGRIAQDDSGLVVSDRLRHEGHLVHPVVQVHDLSLNLRGANARSKHRLDVHSERQPAILHVVPRRVPRVDRERAPLQDPATVQPPPSCLALRCEGFARSDEHRERGVVDVLAAIDGHREQHHARLRLRGVRHEELPAAFVLDDEVDGDAGVWCGEDREGRGRAGVIEAVSAEDSKARRLPGGRARDAEPRGARGVGVRHGGDHAHGEGRAADGD
mmetsp:Transcript_72056/g.165086  ORF Transcript_72056/g.165086 Transcript_72056/m.165086 type:complete len:346 (-) Transcript_72056:379-1416(-)